MRAPGLNGDFYVGKLADEAPVPEAAAMLAAADRALYAAKNAGRYHLITVGLADNPPAATVGP